jgi:hypothetical protein
LAAECKEDIELAVAALVPRFARAKMNEPVNTSQEALSCRTIASMFFGSETTGEFLSREMGQPEDNLCRHIQFYARVSSMENEVNVHCFRDFFSSKIEVTYE